MKAKPPIIGARPAEQNRSLPSLPLFENRERAGLLVVTSLCSESFQTSQNIKRFCCIFFGHDMVVRCSFVAFSVCKL